MANDYKTLVDLWPNPEYRDYPETIEEERARLKASGGHIELIERTDYQRAYRYINSEDIGVDGTEQDLNIMLEAKSSLPNAIRLLQQVAFYAIKGVRIPNILADYFAEAVEAMALEYQSNENSGLNDSLAARKCLNTFGASIGILAGHKRPKVNFKTIGMLYDRISDRVHDEETKKIWERVNSENLTDEELSNLDDEAIERSWEVAFYVVGYAYDLSDQQIKRYLDRYQYWKDWRKEPDF